MKKLIQLLSLLAIINFQSCGVKIKTKDSKHTIAQEGESTTRFEASGTVTVKHLIDINISECNELYPDDVELKNDCILEFFETIDLSDKLEDISGKDKSKNKNNLGELL